MNMEYLPIYLVLLAHLLEFYGFPHINLIHILLHLYLSTSFFGGANVNVLCF